MMLYSPSGMPTMVPDSLKINYIQRGYRTEKPAYLATQSDDLAETIEEMIMAADDDGILEAQEKLQAINLGRQYKRFLNKASKEDLMSVRGIGDATADKIIAARPLKRRTQLLEISKLADWEKILQAATEGE